MILAAWLLIAPSKPKSSIHTHKFIKNMLEKDSEKPFHGVGKDFFRQKREVTSAV